MLNSEYIRKEDRISKIEGTISCKVEKPSFCIVNFDMGMPGNYQVLSTDYSTYAVVYSCTGFLKDLFHFDFVWILSREATISDEKK